MDDKFEEISISELINILIKRKKLIAAVTIVFLVIGILTSFVFTKQKYSSELLLEINNIETTINKPADDTGTTVNVYNVLENIARTNDMDFEDYLDEITSDEVLEKTIKDLKLKDTYTKESLRSVLSVKSDSELKNINLSILTNSSKEGAKILNAIEENFSEHITDISQENALQVLETIEKQMEIEKEKYSESLAEYKGAMKDKKSALELELEIEAVYEQLTNYKLNLNDLNIKKDGVTAALGKSKSDSDDEVEGVILRPNGDDGYIYLDSSKKVLEMDLAETEAKVKSTEGTIKNLQQKTQELQIEYQEIEFEESAIRQKVDLTKQSYEVFSQKYQELKMASSMDVGGISINTISEAEEIGKAVGTRKPIKIAIFLILGIMTGIIASFIVEYTEIMKAKKR